MPNRMLRAALLESDRWVGLRDNAGRVAYIAAVLTADDFGNMEGTTPRLRRLWRDFGIDTDEKVEWTLQEMVDLDLFRVYEVDGKRYVHIPRFGQYVRHTKRANPRSPWDALEQNQGLAEKTQCERNANELRTSSERNAYALRSHPEEKRREVKSIAPSELLDADDPVAESIPVTSGPDIPIRESMVKTFASAYPAIDVVIELRKARAWCIANPKNRKTPAGVMRFLNSWMDRAQNTSRPSRPTQASGNDWLAGVK